MQSRSRFASLLDRAAFRGDLGGVVCPALRAGSTGCAASNKGRGKEERSGDLVGVRRDMERQLHSVVENSYNFDHVAMRGSVHDEMPPASALARNVEGSKIRKDFVTSGASKHIGAVTERGKRLKKASSNETPKIYA
jgi:hypothetical protein